MRDVPSDFAAVSGGPVVPSRSPGKTLRHCQERVKV